jgi:hypothetical protein
LLLKTLLQILSLSGVVELTTQLLILPNTLWLPLCRINKFGLNTLSSKTVAILYTCGLSRPFSGAIAGEHSNICEVTWDLYLLVTMKNLKDNRTKIVPSKTRGGKELPSSSALDSPSVLSKLATPPPTSNSDTSQVIDDATSTMHDAYDDTTILLDNTMPLGEFLDEQLARARENENTETDDDIEIDDYDSPPRYELPTVPEGYIMDEETTRDFLACNDREDLKKLLAKLKEKSLNARMQYDPKFATSPIFVTDKDYEFSVDPELITLVESDPFYGYESETVVAHLTKLNDIATLFANEEKICYYYILKLFPFSLKGDAKLWFNSLAPSCVCSPQDMIYYFSQKYFPAHKKQAALKEIFNFVQIEEESLPQA